MKTIRGTDFNYDLFDNTDQLHRWMIHRSGVRTKATVGNTKYTVEGVIRDAELINHFFDMVYNYARPTFKIGGIMGVWDKTYYNDKEKRGHNGKQYTRLLILLRDMKLLCALTDRRGKANVWKRMWDLDKTMDIKANFVNLVGKYLNVTK